MLSVRKVLWQSIPSGSLWLHFNQIRHWNYLVYSVAVKKKCAVTQSYYWQNLYLVKFVGNCVSSNTWNMKMKVESLPEMCPILGILQTLDSAHCWEDGNPVPEATGCMVCHRASVLSAFISAIFHRFHKILGISWQADQLWLLKIDSGPLELVT